MARPLLLAALSPLLLLVAPSPEGGRGEAEPVVVTNFPETQRVTGAVSVDGPVPSTRLLAVEALVTPGGPGNVADLTEAGVVDAAGFAHATLSLAVGVQGTLTGPARVGALLIPDQPEIVAAFRGFGAAQFPLVVETEVVPSPSGLHHSSSLTARLAFPRYRVFFYNTSARTSEATLYVYLGTS